jgi:hypothetical protein
MEGGERAPTSANVEWRRAPCLGRGAFTAAGRCNAGGGGCCCCCCCCCRRAGGDRRAGAGRARDGCVGASSSWDGNGGTHGGRCNGGTGWQWAYILEGKKYALVAAGIKSGSEGWRRTWV